MVLENYSISNNKKKINYKFENIDNLELHKAIIKVLTIR